MSQDDGGADPLLRAIGEFRQELLQWIDVQLGSLRESESQQEPVPPRGSLTNSAQSNRTESGASPGVGPEKPSARGGDRIVRAPHTVWASPTSEPPSRRPPVTDPTSSNPPADARDRLDALARQLGERLRGADGSRKGAEQADREGPGDDNRTKPS
jgi:hypothetical protein